MRRDRKAKNKATFVEVCEVLSQLRMCLRKEQEMKFDKFVEDFSESFKNNKSFRADTAESRYFLRPLKNGKTSRGCLERSVAVDCKDNRT